MTEPITSQQLDEIETRHTAATKGPWKRSEDYSDIVAPDGSQLASYWMGADGEFIAHAPDDVRALLDEVRRQRAQLADQADADTVAERAAKAITAMGDDLRAMTSERNRYRNAWHNACTRAVDARSDAEGAEAASVPPAAPLSAVQRSSVSESAQSPTRAPTGHLEDLPSTEDLASADNPTHLRWGLNGVLWSDDGSVIVMLSDVEAGKPFWLELDPERAAVLREDLAGPDGAPSPERDALIAELLPAWEAMYEPGNVSDYLIGYANSEAAAKGAAEAWMRSQAEVTGRLEWEQWSDAATLPDGYDALFELIQRHDDGIDTGPGIAVRHRTPTTTAR